MRAFFAIAVVLGLFLAVPAAAATPDAAMAPVIVTPSQLQWQSSSLLPSGGKLAVLGGDLAKPGYYTVRIMLPDGAAFPPHTHASAEYLTVIQGTFMVGLGNTVDAAKMTALTAGSYAAVPAGVAHYAMAKGDTIIQLSGMGPLTMTNVK
jgi:quercetin dioxygenase-like cupin family protein